MDFIDAHSYWHHPNFPGKAWDMGNWLVDQTAMTDSTGGGTLGNLACDRLAGKPYTVSEYNHPAPMDSQAECVPMVAAFAASQDWDGIWLFAYCHRTNDWDRQSFESFFDMDANPGKFGFFGAAAVMFREGGLAPLAGLKVCELEVGKDPLSAFARLAGRYGNSMGSALGGEFKLTWKDMLAGRVYVSTGAQPAAVGRTGKPIDWTVTDGRGRFLAAGERAIAQTGWAKAPGQDKPVFRAVMVAALDGKPLAASGKMLLAACGRCENTGMAFSADRRTVGRNWGGPPVRIEPVDHVLKLPGKAGEKLLLQPLGPDGQPQGQAVEITLDETGTVTLSAAHKTMWYLLTRKQ
jgi:hypothetical protein